MQNKSSHPVLTGIQRTYIIFGDLWNHIKIILVLQVISVSVFQYTFIFLFIKFFIIHLRVYVISLVTIHFGFHKVMYPQSEVNKEFSFQLEYMLKTSWVNVNNIP